MLYADVRASKLGGEGGLSFMSFPDNTWNNQLYDFSVSLDIMRSNRAFNFVVDYRKD